MNNVSDTHPSAPHNVHICCIFLNMTIKTKVKTKEEVLIMMWASEIPVQSVAMGTKKCEAFSMFYKNQSLRFLPALLGLRVFLTD